jgi:hypothetical protein
MDSDNQAGPYEKIYSLLPDYVCGLIWTVDISWVVALNVSISGVYRFANAAARLMNPFHVPEFAIGFLLIVIGVMIPFAAARALNPLMITLLNVNTYRWFKKAPNRDVSNDHLRLAVRRISDIIDITPPAAGWATLFMQYLRHNKTPTVSVLATNYKEIADRTFLAFPVSLFLGLLAFSGCGRGVIAVLVGFAVTIITVLGAIHRSRHALRDWNTNVLFAFLVATANPAPNSPPSVSATSSDEPAR